MLKKGMGKSILMTVLITGNVIWGGTVVYAEEGCSNLIWIRWLLQQPEL